MKLHYHPVSTKTGAREQLVRWQVAKGI